MVERLERLPWPDYAVQQSDKIIFTIHAVHAIHALVNSPDEPDIDFSLFGMFINKSYVTYSCFNFPLKWCFLNIYKKHVSQKRRIIGKDFLEFLCFSREKASKESIKRQSQSPSPFCQSENNLTIGLSESCFWLPFKMSTCGINFAVCW